MEQRGQGQELAREQPSTSPASLSQSWHTTTVHQYPGFRDCHGDRRSKCWWNTASATTKAPFYSVQGCSLRIYRKKYTKLGGCCSSIAATRDSLL